MDPFGAQVYALGAGKRAVPGAEARFLAGLNVRAEAQTYLRSKNNNKSDSQLGSRYKDRRNNHSVLGYVL